MRLISCFMIGMKGGLKSLKQKFGNRRNTKRYRLAEEL
jgi:hypothetical protein